VPGKHFALLFSALILGQSAQAHSLADAVRAALTDHPALKASSEDARASAYDLLQLRGEFQPTVTARAQAGWQRIDEPAASAGPNNGDTQFTRQASIEAELVIFDGYRRANQVYAQAARVDANIFRLLDASETMALNATEVYIDVYRHLLLQDTARRNLARHRQIARQVADLVETGRLPLSDRLQVQARVRAAQMVLIEVERAGADAEARYLRIIGQDRHGPMSVKPAPNHARTRADLESAAIANSFALRVAEKEINEARYGTAITAADGQPNVSLNAGVRAGRNLDGGTGSETDASVGLRMNWVIYKGGRAAQRNAALAREQAAMAERNVILRDVRELAQRTWNSYQSNTERAQLLGIQAGLNRRIIKQYRDEFDAGTRTLLEVLDIERAGFDLEFEKISADASLVFSGYRLLAAQSRLAQHFGAQASHVALEPDFEDRARIKPTNVFKTAIPPLE
jgi:adhesin transport system outer membrane protein